MTIVPQILRKCLAKLDWVGVFGALVLPAVAHASAPVLGQLPRTAAVATEHEAATEAAISVLRNNGNAVDAAVAAALVTGVVAPSSSGLGGGGFALVWLARSHAVHFLDFRERAPEFLEAKSLDSRPLPGHQRGLMVGVPGEPSGLFKLQGEYGHLKFIDVAAVAARLCDDGFRVSQHLAKMARAAGASSEKLAILHALGFDRNPLRAGSWARSPLLGRTLRRYGALGPKGLLEGDIADDWVAAAKESGGVLSLADLRDYRPKERTPLRSSYGRFEVITAPPPSAGGMLLTQTLGTFPPADIAAHNGAAARIHLLAEAYRASFADRASHIGDPDFAAIDMSKLLDPERLRARRMAIRADETHFAPVALPNEHGTSHISVVDAEGNAVALTTTVNNAFGAKILGPKSGVVLNDELDDFGPVGSPNQPRPLARPVSSMTPTIVLDGDRVQMVLGGSGGMTIATNVTTNLLAILVDGALPGQAVEQPRFTIEPHSGDILLEDGFSERVATDLRKRGERVRRVPRGISAVQVIARVNSRYIAAADARKYGSATSVAITGDRH